MTRRIVVATFLFAIAAMAQTRVVHEGASVTAGTGGVTAKYVVVKDGSNPSKYVLPSAATQCPDGVADVTVSAAASFNLLASPNVVYTLKAGGTITAGHLVGLDTSTWGRVVDLGTASWYAVDSSACVVGTATAGATTGNDVTVRFAGPGAVGASNLHSIGATFDGAGSTLVAGSSAVGFQSVPFACTIVSYAINVSPSGTATFHLWRVPSGADNPTSSNDLSTSGFSISTGTALVSSTVTDLSSTAIAAEDIIGINLSAVTGSPTKASIDLRCR